MQRIMKESTIDIYDLYNRMESNNILLSFKGNITSDLMSSILHIMELRMDTMQEDPKVKKKVYNVLVECLQNLYHHIDDIPQHPNGSTDRSAIILVGLGQNGYSITTGNYLRTDRVSDFRGMLDEINGMDTEALKAFYKEVLNNEKRSEKGGGGLGMIDIARKTGKKLNYSFRSLNETHSFFSLNIEVDQQ
jgi:hypothetical protein